MFLLLTGSSGAGKSTARRAIASALAPAVVCVELGDLVEFPARPTIAWRHQATEAGVRRALELQTVGRHLLLAGDPVAAGEVLAAPSAEALEGVAVCLLDVAPEVQTERLRRRGDDPGLLADHVAFAAWMRGHARDPEHMPHVLMTGGWETMVWDRWVGVDLPHGAWAMEIIDTTSLGPDKVATAVLDWCRRALAGEAPLLGRGLR